MAALRVWLVRMVSVAILLTVIQMLITESAIKRAASLIGGILLILVIAEPIMRINFRMIQLDFSEYQSTIEQAEKDWENRQREQTAKFIEEKTASYISDKAAEFGQSPVVHVHTALDENGIPIPVLVELEGDPNPELAAWMRTELGLGEERQVWHGGKS